MVLIHMVWFKWKAEATPEQIEAACEALRGLKAKIPCILEISVGKNVTSRTPHTHGLLVKLAREEDLGVYSDCEAHMEVVRGFIAPIKDEVAALDYVVADE